VHTILTATCKFFTVGTTFNISLLYPIVLGCVLKEFWQQHPEDDEIIISTHI
jgi:hypothetical protein